MPSKREQLLEIMEDAAKGETTATLRARIAELETKNARLERALSRRIDRDISGIFPTEALSRTGAVKVKALEWANGEARSALGDLYEVASLGGSVWQVWWNGTAFTGWHSSQADARLAVQADYERRILSALEPAAPEGQQPAAAGQHVAYFDDGQFHWMSGIAPRNCELYTRPSEQAVTEAMVEASAKELLAHGEFSSIPGNNETNARIAARAALKAAIEAGRPALTEGATG